MRCCLSPHSGVFCASSRRAVCHNILEFSALLSVTTFWSFLREFSPLEVYGGGIRHFLMPRPRVSVDVAGLHRESRRDSGVVVPSFSTISTLFQRIIANRYLGLAAAETQSAVSTQPAIDVRGSHVLQDMFRLASIRDLRAEIRAASSSAGMSFPVPKYISSGV